MYDATLLILIDHSMLIMLILIHVKMIVIHVRIKLEDAKAWTL